MYLLLCCVWRDESDEEAYNSFGLVQSFQEWMFAKFCKFYGKTLALNSRHSCTSISQLYVGIVVELRPCTTIGMKFKVCCCQFFGCFPPCSSGHKCFITLEKLESLYLSIVSHKCPKCNISTCYGCHEKFHSLSSLQNASDMASQTSMPHTWRQAISMSISYML